MDQNESIFPVPIICPITMNFQCFFGAITSPKVTLTSSLFQSTCRLISLSFSLNVHALLFLPTSALSYYFCIKNEIIELQRSSILQTKSRFIFNILQNKQPQKINWNSSTIDHLGQVCIMYRQIPVLFILNFKHF